ncbi:MAG TPA: HIT family protein [Acidimicrobiales bacterium]|nr:HIT family protein [Acidimicrobiales bacterium]
MATTPCTVCALAAGERTAEIVLDEPGVLAFLDVSPLFVGHVLVVPRAHHETLPDLPVALVGELFGAVQRVAAALPAAMEGDGSFVAINNVVSQSVPHLHVHVVPRRRKDGLRGFFWPRTTYGSPAAMADVAETIRRALRKIDDSTR